MQVILLVASAVRMRILQQVGSSSARKVLTDAASVILTSARNGLMTRTHYARKFGEAGSSELRHRHRNLGRELGAPSDCSLR